jgi:hypothetical protein
MHKYRVVISADAYLPDLTENGLSSPDARQKILQDIVEMTGMTRTLDVAQISIFTVEDTDAKS